MTLKLNITVTLFLELTDLVEPKCQCVKFVRQKPALGPVRYNPGSMTL